MKNGLGNDQELAWTLMLDAAVTLRSWCMKIENETPLCDFSGRTKQRNDA